MNSKMDEVLPGKENNLLSTVRAMDCSFTTSIDWPMCTVLGMLPKVPLTNSATSCTVNICNNSSKMAGKELSRAAWSGQKGKDKTMFGNVFWCWPSWAPNSSLDYSRCEGLRIGTNIIHRARNSNKLNFHIYLIQKYFGDFSLQSRDQAIWWILVCGPNWMLSKK